MIRKITTLAVVALAITGMTLLNMYVDPQKTTAAQEEAAKEAAEKLAEAHEATAEPAEAEKPEASESAGDPENTDWPEKTPETFRVAFETTMGTFEVECNRAWAPRGADRFYELVKGGYYNGNRFFRVVKGFVVQFGINGDPKVSAKWEKKFIKSDPVMQSNTEGYVTFAMAPGDVNSRTTQVFVNLGDNSNLDSDGFAPFAKVVKGMDVVKSFNGQYRDRPTSAQGQIRTYGNEFLDQKFPGLDYVKKATLVK